MKKKKKGGEEDEKKKWWKSRFNLIGQSVESRRLRSRRAFLDHHRPCSSITRRRRRRGGVRCRRRDAQWSCRPRLFEQYASTRRDDTDPDRALSRRSSSAREFRSKSFVHVTEYEIIYYLRSSWRFPPCARAPSVNVSSFGIRRKTMWPTGRFVSSSRNRGDWKGKRGYIIICESSKWSMKWAS